MESKYNFTLDTFKKERYEHYNAILKELMGIEPITSWEDLKVGEVYHLPNLLIQKRADFVINEKKTSYINGMIKEEGSGWKPHSLFKNEVRTKFLVKKWV